MQPQTATSAELAGFLFISLVRRFGRTFVVLDALSVGLFTIVGVERALLCDLPYVTFRGTSWVMRAQIVGHHRLQHGRRALDEVGELARAR